MQIPGLLVEYLINGSCALIWIWGVFKLINIELPTVSDARLLLLVPGLYVVGMVVDRVAKGTVELLRYSVLALPLKKLKQRNAR